jgi:hypothetical protein
MTTLLRTPTAGLLLALFALLAAPPRAAAWGATGHRVVGAIAQRHLAPETARAVAELLGSETLAEASTWADFIRSDPAWRHADSWHWVTLPDGQGYEETEKNPQGDLLEALVRFETTLRDRAAPVERRREALRFLVHLVGDLHQPLHVGRGDDRGGNQVLVTWFGEPTDLHTVWDSKIIASEELSYTEWVAFLDRLPLVQQNLWRCGNYLSWAEESRQLRPLVYDLGDRWLSWDYRYRAIPVVRERLLQAGLRLAVVLDRALGTPQ